MTGASSGIGIETARALADAGAAVTLAVRDVAAEDGVRMLDVGSLEALMARAVAETGTALILMHSGRDTGLGGMGFTPQSQGGTHIVERNLTRVTLVVAVLFFANTVLLFRLLK